jgi:hypothetical protein
MPRGSACKTFRRDSYSEGPGRTTATTFYDEHDCRPRLLSVRPLRLPHFPRPLLECEVYPGAGTGMEADAEMALIYSDSGRKAEWKYF